MLDACLITDPVIMHFFDCLTEQAVAKYMPTAEPMLDTTVYEMVLQDFLQNNHEVTCLFVLFCR